MAFVSQTPWVQNMTFRDNVTYMSPNAPSAALYRTAVQYKHVVLKPTLPHWMQGTIHRLVGTKSIPQPTRYI